jgi:predicted ATPase
MSHDRITQLRIFGLRVIEDLTLNLHGTNVLIGDNGTGKSSILEALELLRQAAKPVSYVTDIVVRAHGGLQSLLRRGAKELRLGVTIEGAGPKLDYEFSLGDVGTTPTVLSERVDMYMDPNANVPFRALTRVGAEAKVFNVAIATAASNLARRAGQYGADAPQRVPIDEERLTLPWLGVNAPPDLQRLTDALSRIEVHAPFETRPIWQQRELDIRVGPRWPGVVERSEALERYGLNLANAYQQLRNLGNDTWSRVVDRARLSLGEDLRDFRLPASGRGNIELEVLFGRAPDKPFRAAALSEGQLSYLAFIALVELNRERSVLAFDEPELHLHPALLARVVWMLEQVAETTPVILATHSDRLLDALGNPQGSVVLCNLDAKSAVQLQRPDANRLAEWLQSYRGLGSIRAEGYESHIFLGRGHEGPGR